MRIASALLLSLLATPSLAAPPEPDGDWFTEDKLGVIHVGPCGNGYCGSIVGISDWQKDGSPPRDTQGRSECHLVIIRLGARPEDDGRRHGTVTNPDDGRTYSAELWVGEDGGLRLRGYVGVPLLGSTQHWTKFPGTYRQDCHFSVK